MLTTLQFGPYPLFLAWAGVVWINDRSSVCESSAYLRFWKWTCFRIGAWMSLPFLHTCFCPNRPLYSSRFFFSWWTSFAESMCPRVTWDGIRCILKCKILFLSWTVPLWYRDECQNINAASEKLIPQDSVVRWCEVVPARVGSAQK